MIDLARIIQEAGSAFEALKPTDFPLFVGNEELGGNNQIIDKKGYSHLSHLSHHEYVDPKNLGFERTSDHSVMRVSARATSASSEKVGTVGMVGNGNDVSELLFPPLSFEVGKVGKDRSAGCNEVVASWRAQFLALGADTPPCPGFLRREWLRVRAAALAFLDRHANAAAGFGWDAVSLFGVHPVVGVSRVDCCGALMVSGGSAVITVDHDVLVFERMRFHRRVLTPDAVLVWDFPTPDNRPLTGGEVSPC